VVCPQGRRKFEDLFHSPRLLESPQGFAELAFNFKDYTVERFAEMVGWELTLIEGVLEDECIALYRDASVELTR